VGRPVADSIPICPPLFHTRSGLIRRRAITINVLRTNPRPSRGGPGILPRFAGRPSKGGANPRRLSGPPGFGLGLRQPRLDVEGKPQQFWLASGRRPARFTAQAPVRTKIRLAFIQILSPVRGSPIRTWFVFVLIALANDSPLGDTESKAALRLKGNRGSLYRMLGRFGRPAHGQCRAARLS
jgi:hypothetical protein